MARKISSRVINYFSHFWIQTILSFILPKTICYLNDPKDLFVCCLYAFRFLTLMLTASFVACWLCSQLLSQELREFLTVRFGDIWVYKSSDYQSQLFFNFKLKAICKVFQSHFHIRILYNRKHKCLGKSRAQYMFFVF